MLPVTIESEDISVKSGTSARTGNPYTIRSQKGWVVIPGKPYPVEFQFNLENDAPPYVKGKYRITPGSFYVGRFGDLMLRVSLETMPPVGAGALIK